MWHEIIVAFCLVLVLEGIMPFLSPGGWRRGLLAISQLGDGQIRGIGLASMLIGAGLLYLINH